MLMSQTSMLRASEAEEELAKISDMIALTLSQSSGITHCTFVHRSPVACVDNQPLAITIELDW